MTGVKTSDPAGFAEFKLAERALWDYYDLDPEERLVSFGDRQVVRLHEIGEGEPVLFVHGTGGSGVYFAPLLSGLAPAFRCILIDRPGWTLSSPLDYSGGFSAIASQFLDNLLAALDIDRAHVIGGSIGNMYALRLALDHPERVGNVVLLAGAVAEGVTPPTFLRVLRTPLGRVIVRVPQKPGMIRKQLQRLGHQESLARGLIPYPYINVKAAESRYTSALQNERLLVRSVLARRGFQPGIILSDDELASISSNTLMIYGSDDPLGSEELWNGFIDRMPNATLHVAPDSGHLPWFDDPSAAANLILTHLRTPPASGARPRF